MFARVRRTAANSDACTCPTPALAERLRHLHVPVYLLPNGFDDVVVAKSRLAARLRAASRRDGLCRIGYAAGSRTHQRDFAVAAESIARVLRTHDDVRLVLYHRAFDLDEFPVFDDLRDRIEWRELVPIEDLPLEMARYDVNLAPLEVGNPFCEAKSALKFFEAALVDVPTIASPTQPFRAVIRTGETGVLADGVEEWHAALDRLVTDAGLRADIGRAARDAVLWEHGVEHRTQTVKSILDQVLDNGMVAAAAFACEVNRHHVVHARPESAPATVLFERDSLRVSDVTVVVPVFNYEALVTDALDSVRNQTLSDLDLVIVDDASTDGSRARIVDWLELHASRFNRVMFLGNTENAGLARARNNGFDAAETPYVLPLDADNVLLPKCCAHLLDAVRITNAAFAYPRIRQFGEFTDLFRREHVVGYLPWTPQRLVSSNYIDAMALIRKDSWLVAGGYRQGLRGWEDYDLWCRFAERGSYGLRVPEELARYRVHAQSMLHTETNEPQANPILRADMTSAHPWLALDDRHPDDIEADAVAAVGAPPPLSVAVQPGADAHAEPEQTSADAAPESDDGSLSPRSRELLAILRCPETGEPLEEAPGGGVRSAMTHRAWPVVAGRPVLFPGRPEPEVFPEEHLGNPLPERARALIAEVDGLVLHMSGGGTVAGGERVIDLDAAIFGPTDIIGDAHVLPFADATFDLVIAMNAFEHYRDPRAVVAQIERVLKPGGQVFLHTAFLQPVHEAPHHYFNCTAYGLREWFAPFDTIDLRVSENFHPGFALSWLASDLGELLEAAISPGALHSFRSASIGEFADFWRDPRTRDGDARWAMCASLPEDALERAAAGFEYLGRRRSS
jgi:SAM-dependent methyltransferase